MTFHKTGGNMDGAGSVAPIQETTLGQYIERKEKAYKEKMTFEEWFAEYNEKNGLPSHYTVAKYAWKAAQENV